jgi:hypothetical protein
MSRWEVVSGLLHGAVVAAVILFGETFTPFGPGPFAIAGFSFYLGREIRDMEVKGINMGEMWDLWFPTLTALVFYAILR